MIIHNSVSAAELAALESLVGKLRSAAYREQHAGRVIKALGGAEKPKAARQEAQPVLRTQRRPQRPSEARHPPPQPKAQPPIVLSTRRGAIHHGALMTAEMA